MFEILALDIGYGYTKGAIPGRWPVIIPSLTEALTEFQFMPVEKQKRNPAEDPELVDNLDATLNEWF